MRARARTQTLAGAELIAIPSTGRPRIGAKALTTTMLSAKETARAFRRSRSAALMSL